MGSAGVAAELTHCAVSPAEGEVSAEEEGFENLNTMASTFIVLFLLGLFYSTTVTLFKVGRLAAGSGWRTTPGDPHPHSCGLCHLQVK